MFVKPKLRGFDGMGSGAFGASRGSRKHKGIDLCCTAGAGVYSHVGGIVSKIGYPYPQKFDTKKNSLKSALRYVEITDRGQNKHRFFYVDTDLEVGSLVEIGHLIGKCSNLNAIWGRRMKNHVHYEVKVDGYCVDPADFL